MAFRSSSADPRSFDGWRGARDLKIRGFEVVTGEVPRRFLREVSRHPEASRTLRRMLAGCPAACLSARLSALKH